MPSAVDCRETTPMVCDSVSGPEESAPRGLILYEGEDFESRLFGYLSSLLSGSTGRSRLTPEEMGGLHSTRSATRRQAVDRTGTPQDKRPSDDDRVVRTQDSADSPKR